MKDNHIHKKSQGGFLITFLILFIIVQALQIIGTISLLSLGKSSFLTELATTISSNPIINYFSIIISVVGLTGAILIFIWKKIGVYFYISSVIMDLIKDFLTNTDTHSLIYSVCGTAIGLVIFYFIIRNVYKYFT